MLLVVQIALGMLLGFLLIEYRKQLGRLAKIILRLALVAVAVGFVATAASKVASASGLADWHSLALVVSFAARFLGAVVGVGLLAVCALGLYLLFRWPCGDRLALSPPLLVVMLFLFVNMLIVWAVTTLLMTLTPYGGWYAVADGWSRGNGYADLGGVLMTFPFAAWPWIVILGLKMLHVSVPVPDLLGAGDDANESRA